MPDHKLVQTLLKTRGRNQQAPSTVSDLSLSDAYDIAHELHRLESKEGKTLIGRKIGISNKQAWPSLGLSDIVWAYLYSDSVFFAPDNHFELSLKEFIAPKIEPEIVFGLKKPLPNKTRDPLSLLESVAWIALGFEIVDCPYENWRFSPSDLVATFGLHAALVIGKKIELDQTSLAPALANCKAELRKSDQVVAKGGGHLVVDSPAIALGHLADLISQDKQAQALGQEEIISSGTLTPNVDIQPGERYTASITGLDLPELTLRLRL